MESTAYLALTGFIQGIALILSPCILPILPLMLSGSVDGGKKRPVGITIGFVLTFAVFTLFSRKIVIATGIDTNTIRYIAYGLLIFLGITMISTRLSNVFASHTQSLANLGHKVSQASNDKNDFTSGITFGALVALIWTPCAGPILATVIVQTVLQETSFSSFVILLCFSLGAGIPMLLISLFGQSLLKRASFLKTHTETIRKSFGVIVILSVIVMIYNETTGSTLESTVQETLITPDHLLNPVSKPYPAPEFQAINHWINSNPLTMAELKGKVVLIDFWTYSCINCKRTLPYLKAWYANYHDLGFEIIGVHTPEFEFEKNPDNISMAVKQYGILYPVAVDDSFGTWQAYHNQYWPAHYLIDQNGQVVYTHFGEGDYDITEENIRFLLNVKGKEHETITADAQTNSALTPETYFGFARADRAVNKEPLLHDAVGGYTYPASISENHWALQGKWIVNAQQIMSAERGASLSLHFHAKDVYAVMGSPNHPVQVRFTLNGTPLSDTEGSDVMNSQILVGQSRLYHIVHFADVEDGTLELTAISSGLEVYTFTFGN